MVDKKDCCLYCKSENTQFIKTYSIIGKEYSKPISASSRYIGLITYNTVEILCLDCGAVSNFLPNDQLQVYKENKQYFNNSKEAE